MFVRRSLPFGPFVIFACVLAGRSVSSQSPAPPAANPIIYTEEQAARGAEIFSTVCLECHGRKDMSSADFKVKWSGRPVFDLFERIRSTMPESGPGSLARSQYLDVTTYIAKLNGVAAGATELPDDEDVLKKLSLTLGSGGP